MRVFGSGSPIVLVPGIQGRWEWMAPAVRALAEQHRVHTFSLGDVQGAGLFDRWAALIDRAVGTDATPVSIAGVSFGGLVALYYAATRPDRVRRLVLASTPSPRWQIDRRSLGYVRRPRLSMPLFAARGAARLHHEVRRALPSPGRRARFAATHLGRALRYPVSPAHMADCVRAWTSTDLAACCGRITAPTLVITGEPALDLVVPVSSSLDYLELLPEVRHVTLERTGHLGLVLRPRDFAALVTDFVDDGTRQARQDSTGRPRERCT